METIKILVSGNFLCNNALLACSIKQYDDILKKKKKKKKSLNSLLCQKEREKLNSAKYHVKSTQCL